MRIATSEWGSDREGTISILESFPYSLPEAIADIVDNSLDAGAKTVLVEVNHVGGEQYVLIKDDGKGIAESEFEDVMKIGKRRNYSDDDLGAFGVGLKSAGLTQARNITIFSKQKGSKMNIRRISVPWMKETGRWSEMLHSDTNSPVVEKISEEGRLPDDQGTTVLLENLHRFDSMIHGEQSDAVTIINILPGVENHLRMIYHRFLENKDHPRHFSLIFPAGGDNTTLDPLDPMEPHEDDKKYGTLTKKADITIDYEGSKFIVPVSLIILSHSKRCKDNKFRKDLSETVDGGVGELEGVYMYRNDRLIAFAKWFGIFSKTAVGTLRRITIDVDPKLDLYFGLTPSKTNYRLPQNFRTSIKKKLSEKKKWIDSDNKDQTFNERAVGRYRHDGRGVGGKRKVQRSSTSPTPNPPNVPKPNPLPTGGENVVSSEEQHVDRIEIKKVMEMGAPLFKLQNSMNKQGEIELNGVHPWYIPLRLALKRWLDVE